MGIAARLAALRDGMENDLRQNVLPFWVRHVVDEEHGGFHGFVTDDLRVDPLAPKGGVLNARILWSYSAALRRYGDPVYRRMADRAFECLLERFWDEEHGGLYWMLDHSGRPIADRKQVYNLAFGLYGLAEYHRATGRPEALARAVRLYEAIERHAADDGCGGYWEARARDWSPLADVRLSEKDRNAPKSMNTHLHILEAYTNLLRVRDDARPRGRLRALVEVHLDRIVDPATHHLRLFFDEHWAPIGRTVSYGHDIEASWLLTEAARRLGDPGLLARATEAALGIARVTLAEGFDHEHGGVFAERGEDGHLDDEKHWWMQAEAVVGFLNAYELTKDEAFLEAAERTWSFIDRFLVDHAHGEWRWRVRRGGSAVPGLPKVEPWKCPYHNTRAALETIERVDRLA
jgi:mannobiose 2-epimerase